MSNILRFTLIMGALSSAFDLAMFWMLVRVFEVSPDVFRTAWFVESTATQILVIFIIRTSRLSWASRANPLLVTSSLGALGLAFAIVLMPWGADLGFAHLPGALFAAITGVVIAYLAAADVFKTFAIRSPQKGA
jgi:Mg2+-importing ATPase